MSSEDKKTPLVSVIINCYNSEKYLLEAMESVFFQTYSNWELIFWDNASTDGSAAIVKEFEESTGGERVKYHFSSVNKRLGAARKEAVNVSSGEYIAFLDCDDIWLPTYLERQVAALNDTQYALSYSGVITINSDGQKLSEYTPSYLSGNIFPQLLNQFDINMPASMIRRSAIDELGLNFDDNIRASEEYCLFMQLLAHNEASVIAEPLAKYRIHNDSLTNHSIEYWADEREYTLNKIAEAYPSVVKEYAKGFKLAYARAAYYRARFYMHNNERSKARKEIGKNKFLDIKYFILYVMLFGPSIVWNVAHKLYRNRDV